ncbi:MAG: 16S rRNA (cytidine(1402)-2'-O)-methyltransferase [Alphaproteobacteria bacterium]|nr:16S rRNA (cytidine(1402)-2'-O)-methyltransferase [Alphaproteobacteria bacterium]
MKNGLYIIATPIGNLGDISARAVETLKEAPVIACEDTRVTKKLFSLLGISLKKTFITLHDHNEDEQAQKLIDAVQNEQQAVALVSDAGSPLISDPGYKLIRRCREQGVYITVLPGACALICALQLSGLPTNKFMFAGFIPNKDKARIELFKSYAALDATVVYYETAPRILKTLAAAKEVFGGRELAVVREISKIYEECLNGTAEDLMAHFSEKEPKGEFVFMVAPAEEKSRTPMEIEELLREKLLQMSLKSAVKALAGDYNLNKNDVYELALKIKNEK